MNRPESKYKPRIRREKPKLLVVVNGETEEHYFRQFPVPGQLLTVECHGKISSKKLVDKAIELRDSLTEKRKYDQEFGDQTWIVIDREGNDSNNRQNFIDALEAAQDNNIVVAHSNRAFELWCLLHLKYEDGQQLSVEELIRRLNKALKKAKTGYQYKKPGAKMYGYIERFQHQAIENAKKLEQKTGGLPPADADPSTSVYRLVEELNQIKQSSRRGWVNDSKGLSKPAIPRLLAPKTARGQEEIKNPKTQ